MIIQYQVLYLTLRKITVDSSVRYIPKKVQTKERDSKPRTAKAGSLPRKENKKTITKQTKWISCGFGILNRIMNCYF